MTRPKSVLAVTQQIFKFEERMQMAVDNSFKNFRNHGSMDDEAIVVGARRFSTFWNRKNKDVLLWGQEHTFLEVLVKYPYGPGSLETFVFARIEWILLVLNGRKKSVAGDMNGK